MGAAVARSESRASHHGRLSMSRSWIKRVFARARVRLERDAPERDMDEEMYFHLEMATRRNMERGMAPDDARQKALAAFGGVAQHHDVLLPSLIDYSDRSRCCFDSAVLRMLPNGRSIPSSSFG